MLTRAIVLQRPYLYPNFRYLDCDSRKPYEDNGISKVREDTLPMRHCLFDEETHGGSHQKRSVSTISDTSSLFEGHRARRGDSIIWSMANESK